MRKSGFAHHAELTDAVHFLDDVETWNLLDNHGEIEPHWEMYELDSQAGRAFSDVIDAIHGYSPRVADAISDYMTHEIDAHKFHFWSKLSLVAYDHFMSRVRDIEYKQYTRFINRHHPKRGQTRWAFAKDTERTLWAFTKDIERMLRMTVSPFDTPPEMLEYMQKRLAVWRAGYGLGFSYIEPPTNTLKFLVYKRLHGDAE